MSPSLRTRLAQLVMVGVGSQDRLAALLASDVTPGGFFVNEAAAARLATLRERRAQRNPVVAVDDEGGRVQRLRGLLPDLPSARLQATVTPAELQRTLADRGRRLRNLGVTVDFAPVLDLTDAAADAVIGDRSYGTDPAQVVTAARAFAAGLRQGGVLPTWKHFPGHGRASGDSHKGVVTTPPMAQMVGDIEPYRQVIGDGPALVMMGHLVVPGLTDAGQPATVSPAAYRYLREQVGFDGVVITDDLHGMKAITSRSSTHDAAVAAILAGADMALMVDDASFDRTLDGLERAVRDGRLSARGLAERLGRLAKVRGCAP